MMPARTIRPPGRVSAAKRGASSTVCRRGCWRSPRQPLRAASRRPHAPGRVPRCHWRRRCHAWPAVPADRYRRRARQRRPASPPPVTARRSRSHSRSRAACREPRIEPGEAQRGARMRAGAEGKSGIQVHHDRTRRAVTSSWNGTSTAAAEAHGVEVLEPFTLPGAIGNVGADLRRRHAPAAPASVAPRPRCPPRRRTAAA